jgi:hypothetical protein
VIEDHELIQQALAAHALHALDGEDASRLEELLTVHLPACAWCRADLTTFEAISGELALAAGSKHPPRTLGRRVRKHADTQTTGPRWLAATVASVAVFSVGGLALWNAHLSTRVGEAEVRQARTTAVLTTVSHPMSQVVSLDVKLNGLAAQLAAAFVPGQRALYLFGSMPAPDEDRVYQVWMIHRGRFSSAGTFVPERGVVLLQLAVNPQSYDGLLITEEPMQGSPSPSEKEVMEGSLNG